MITGFYDRKKHNVRLKLDNVYIKCDIFQNKRNQIDPPELQMIIECLENGLKKKNRRENEIVKHEISAQADGAHQQEKKKNVNGMIEKEQSRDRLVEKAVARDIHETGFVRILADNRGNQFFLFCVFGRSLKVAVCLTVICVNFQ